MWKGVDVDSVIEQIKGWELKFENEFPIGSGLGSSASFSVSFSGALYCIFMKTEFESPMLNEIDYKRIKELADEGEMIAHGKRASGIDTTTCLLGGAIKYKLNDSGPEYDRVQINQFYFDVFSTKIERNTGVSVFGIA